MNGDFEGVVLVKTDDGAVRVRSYGMGGEPGPPTDAPFPVGSITKTFTAAAIQRLELAGTLSLSDPVSRFVPELAEGDRITIEDLLLHRSGVTDYYTAPGFQEVRTEPMPLDAFARWISAFPLDHPPGSSSGYSNSGYNLLALIVERAAGVPYAAVLRDTLFRPLGMSSARADFRPSAVPPGRRPRAAPELLGPPAPLEATWLLGSGSASASAMDLVRWAEDIAKRVADGWPPYGWGVRGEGEDRYLSQNGRIPGYAAVVEHHPRHGLTVVVLSTVESDAVSRIAAGATAVARNEVVTPEPLREEVALDPASVPSYTGVYDFGDGFRLTVAPLGPGLGIGVGEGPDLQLGSLQPLGNDVFFFREAYIEVRFERTDAGDVSGLTWGGAGPFPRI
jgi:CubicO group peptidase (beta-lactamase class C family)